MSHSIKEKREELLALIIKDSYRKGKFILSSGKESDYYIDARIVALQPRGTYLIAELMLDLVKDVDYAAIGGPTLGADPMIGSLGVVSMQNNCPKPLFIIRKEAKAHGKGKQIEGPALEAGATVVLVDDVATTGKAFIHSLDVLEPMGVKVAKAVCIVDRNDGAKEVLAARGVELLSIFNINEIHK